VRHRELVPEHLEPDGRGRQAVLPTHVHHLAVRPNGAIGSSVTETIDGGRDMDLERIGVGHSVEHECGERFPRVEQ
jgi:hypothetical protein